MAAHRCLYVSIWHVVAVIAATVPSAWGQDDLWSLQPIQQSEQPTLHPDHRQRVRNPIDRFVMARLANGGLDLSPPAERATYLRRVTLDLIGLLPTHIEVQEFLRDSRTDACERTVDRLLASPHYGERWGRHWLDVVRYAESNGFERNKLRDNFWRYRDYVIESFNRDKPYDQFIRERIAGGLLAECLTYRHVEPGYRLTDVHGDVVTGLLS